MCSHHFFKGIYKSRIFENYSLASLTTMRLGGRAKFLVKVYDKNELLQLMNRLTADSYNWLVLGKGSNMVFSDKGFDGVIIQLDGEFKRFDIQPEENSLFIGGGVTHSELMPRFIELGLSGLEFMCGYPGTIGGDIHGNSGTRHQNTADRIKTVEMLDIYNMLYNWIPLEEMQFSYRSSGVKKNIVCGARFFIEKSQKSSVIQRCKIENEGRKNQPRSLFTAGCIFKNTQQESSGKIIEQSGLKGISVGDMYLYPQHANFIVNRGNGTQMDLKKLIEKIRNEVLKKTGIFLELEIDIINENGELWV